MCTVQPHYNHLFNFRAPHQCVCTCVCVCISACTCARVHACVCVYMRVSICVYYPTNGLFHTCSTCRWEVWWRDVACCPGIRSHTWCLLWSYAQWRCLPSSSGAERASWSHGDWWCCPWSSVPLRHALHTQQTVVHRNQPNNYCNWSDTLPSRLPELY